jgi:signal transduction histidine kinase
MRRLHLQIYVTVVASLILVVVLAGILWRFGPAETPMAQAFELAGELVAAQLPPTEATREMQQRSIERLHREYGLDLALLDRERRLIAAAGNEVPSPGSQRQRGGWVHGRGGPAWAIRLPDDRWVVARPLMPERRPVLRLLTFLGGIALVVALCAYPLVRWLTGRIERLQAAVESLGAGDLKARVKVEGKDEVARLAESFNRAAARIEELVAAHRRLLADTSHELRTPLSRIRLGIELLKEKADAKRQAELERDIAELDGLIDQLLVSSRLQAAPGLENTEEVDLLALVAEEAARYRECTVQGTPVLVSGDRALLQRLVRNLIDNAERHGRPPIEVAVGRDGKRAVLTVCDGGPGVEESEREKVFSPFYRPRGGSSSGAGLGLALVRQIAREHGGDAVWAGTKATPSTIRVTLPALV